MMSKPVRIRENTIKKLDGININSEKYPELIDRIVDFYDKNVVLIVDKRPNHRPKKALAKGWNIL
jgi:hypothetical protein